MEPEAGHMEPGAGHAEAGHALQWSSLDNLDNSPARTTKTVLAYRPQMGHFRVPGRVAPPNSIFPREAEHATSN